MRKFIYLIPLLFMSFGSVLYAEEVSIQAKAPSQVAVGERFRLEFTLNVKPSEFIQPTFPNFRIISGPNQSSSSSVQIINGQVTQSQSVTYTYILEASQEGNYTIGSAVVKHNRSEYRSDPISISVVQRSASSASQGQTSKNTQIEGLSNEDLFIRAFVSNQSPYQGEQVVVHYKIYTKVNIAQYSLEKIPGFQGFWTEDVKLGSNQQAQTEVVNGISYRVAEIRRIVAFPQRSGELTIEPLELECIVQIPSQRRRGSTLDDFFGGSFFGQYQNERVSVKSNPIKLNVKSLPTQNRPASFNGLVGRFDISASLSPQQLKSNDAANLVITISGNGNLRMIEKPNIQFPKNLETFDPNLSDNIAVNANGISGSRKFDYLLIPRTGGEFIIPSIQFSYFDPTSQKYISKKTQEFKITAEAGQYVAGSTDTPTREDVSILNDDIRFIYTKPIILSNKGKFFFRSSLFYFLIFFPIVVFALLVIFWRRHIQLQSNRALVKNRKAQKIARKRLKTAQKHLKENNNNLFYEEVSRALWGYISDKFTMPPSILNRENIEKGFRDKQVSEDLSLQFLTTLDECEYARFAPGDPQSLMEDVFAKAESTIINIEKDFKNNK